MMARSLTKEEEQLLQLCEEGTAAISQFAALLDRGARLGVHNKKGWYPLWMVSRRGRSDIADLFLQHGAEVDLANDDKFGNTALIGASINGHLETAKLLVHRGAVINYQRKDGYTALYFASLNNHLEVVKFLLESGAQVNKGTQTSLYGASLKGNVKVVQYLLDHGADVNQPNDNKLGETALITACANGHIETAKLLVHRGAMVNFQRKDGYTALLFASKNNYLQVVKFLLESGAQVNKGTQTGLYVASFNGNLKIVQYFLDHGADVNQPCDGKPYSSPLGIACEKNRLQVAELLIKYGANINYKDGNGDTALHWASTKGHPEVVKLLVQSHANVNIKNNDFSFGRTPLQLAKTPEIINLLKPKADQCTQCSRKFTLYRRQHNCHRCLAPVCDNCSKHRLPISDLSSKPEKVCNRCFDDLTAQRRNESRPLSEDELRILNIVLVEYVDKLNNVGLYFEGAIANQPATDQPIVTKKRVVQCLQQIGQQELAGILIKNQGIRELQDHVYKNVYKSALRSENAEVRLQVFKMILSGVPRSGKTTFWKRLAMKDFVPSETSTSTGAAESHFLSAHMSTEMLLDLHLYSETDTEDLTTEALTIYKHILEAAPIQTDSSHSESVVPSESSTTSPEEESMSIPSKSISDENDQSQATDIQTPEESQHDPHSTDPHTNQQVEASTANQISTRSMNERVPVKFAYHEIIDEDILSAQKQEIEQISMQIDEYFDDLTSLLQKGEKVPTNIPLIKKICHLIDTGGQRAFLELLPTVTVGKALYLLFFSYEHFDSRIHETVQQQGASTEVHTGTFYKQMDIVMQSLICVSSTSSISKDNVALLVGTHVDKVESQHVDDVNIMISKKVEPFLKSGLVFADEERDKMVLEVSIEETKRCSNRPEDYRKVILDIAENKLSCPESEKLPPSWYMFSIVLRRMKIAGHSVLRYSHCQQIARKLYIKETQLQSLLSRLHKILGIVMYFPEIRELEDLVICDPSIVYRGISELIFNSFTKFSTVLSLRLKKWGIFTYRELKEYCKSKSMNKGCQLLIDQLIIILQHLGIIAPVKFSEPDDSSAEPKDEKYSSQTIDAEFIIIAILNDARQEELKLQLRSGEACSIIPLRLYFKCGFFPMGGFCYLFTRLISDRKWKLPLEKEEMMTENKVYWRNKATFIVEADQKKYFVTLVSTKVYYEIHIVHTHSKEPFQLGTDGRNICRKVWNNIETVISNSLNAPLKEYTVACQCTLHGKEELEHVIKFKSKPHDDIEIKATCLLDKNQPHPLTVDALEQSVIVWFKEPRDHRVKDLGSIVKLSTDHLFMTTTSSEQLEYQWSRIINDEVEKIEDDKYLEDSDSKTMVINGFETKYTGTYRCVISTTSRPVVSMSAEVELDLPEPPEEFSTEMSNRQFLLYLNVNGIHYDVCKKLKENKITAKEFNLDSYKVWPLDLYLTSIEKKALLSLLVVADYMKCPVCLNVQVDPCTLSCGHTFCQLCLAHMWKNNEKSCPVCKEIWKVLPGVSYSYRTNIECTHSHEVEQLRKQYTFEEKQIIKEFLEAKESFNQKSKTLLQELEEKSLPEWPLLRFTNLKYLDHEQLYVWLCDHPRFMTVDYQHDIEKLKDAKISGNVFLSLNKDSLEHYGLSTEFQTPLMKIIEEVETYPKSPETKIELQPHPQKSLKCVLTTATDSSGTDVLSTEQSKSEIENIDAAQSKLAEATDLAVWTLPGVEECDETNVVVYSSQGQLVEWNGLKLHIHAGSLPEGLQQCTIFIKASLAGEYEIPENTSLVSGVFWIRCKPQCTFIKPIMIEIQHCSTKRDLSKLKIVRAFCNQKSLPYKFKPLGGSFNSDTFYGAIDMKGFSGVAVIEENPERLYYNQLIYCSNQSQQRHDVEIYIVFTWNTDIHINYVSQKYPEQLGFITDYYQVVELDGDTIRVDLAKGKWTELMDGQWETHPKKAVVTKTELDDFKPDRAIPNCLLLARPLCEDFPYLLHVITLNGIKPPYNELTLSYAPIIRDSISDATQQPQAPPTVQQNQVPTPVDVHTQSLIFSKDMSNEQIALWLRNHPSLSGADYEKDISTLIDAKINAHVFLKLNESRLSQFGISLGFKFAIMSIIEDILQKSSHQPSSSERLPLQQQYSGISVATTTTTQHQLSFSSAGQQTKLDELPTLDELLILKYTNEGKRHKIRIIREASHKWKDIANLICGDVNVTITLEDKCRGDPNECLKRTFIDYFINKKPQGYTQDWNGLTELLDDIDLQTLAEKVKHAFLCV